jgi:hypothetical protein
MLDAIDSGSAEVCEWFKSEGCSFKKASIPTTIAGGRPEVCEWLLKERGGVLTYDRMNAYYATWSGSIEMCEWLHSRGYPWEEFIPNISLKEGKRELCQFLLDKGCRWELGSTLELAPVLDLDLFLWMTDRGYVVDPGELNSDLFDRLALHNKRDLFEYLLPRAVNEVVVTIGMIPSGDDDLIISRLEWLCSLGLRWSTDMMWIDKGLSLKVCEWMVENGYNTTPNDRDHIFFARQNTLGS